MAGNVKIRVECPQTGVQEFEGDNVILLIADKGRSQAPSFISKGDVFSPSRFVEMILFSADKQAGRLTGAIQQAVAHALIDQAIEDYQECHKDGKDYMGSTITHSHSENMEAASDSSAQAPENAAEAVSKAKRYSLLASIFESGADLLCKDLGNQDKTDDDGIGCA